MNAIPPPRAIIFQSIKVPLETICKNHNGEIVKIKGYTSCMHKIAIHTLLFLKLYYIHNIELNNNYITINKKLIENIAKVVSLQGGGRPPSADTLAIRAPLIEFYNNHYSDLIPDNEIRPTSLNLNTVILYFAEEAITMFENLIKQRYHEYVDQYVAHLMMNTLRLMDIDDNVLLTAQQKKAAKSLLLRVHNSIVHDVFVLDTDDLGRFNYTSLQYFAEEEHVVDPYDPNNNYPRHRRFLADVKNDVLPNNHHFDHNSVHYDLKVNPMQYFEKMVFIMRELEQTNHKVENVFPLITEVIPRHFRMDTTTLIKMLYPEEGEAGYDYVMNRTYNTKRSAAVKAGYLTAHKDLLWDLFFYLNNVGKNGMNGIFHSSTNLDQVHNLVNGIYGNYRTSHWSTFRWQIMTDGISATVLLVAKSHAHLLHPHSLRVAPLVEVYIHDIDEDTRQVLSTMNIVAIDPGKSDILSAEDPDNHKSFRYTQNQRRFETGSGYYRKILLTEKRATMVAVIRPNNGPYLVGLQRNIEQLETEFGQHNNKKVLTFEAFSSYIKNKLRFNLETRPFYNHPKHRKRRFQRYRKRQKSEAKMLNNFRAIFGPPGECAIVIGDFCQNYHMRFVEPVKGKGFRNLFRRAGYRHLYLVDEFRTSSRCSSCEGGICSQFRRVKNPKPRSRNAYPIITCRGLLRCENPKCRTLWNRDVLGRQNIHKIAKCAIFFGDRPDYLMRGN